MFFSDEVGEIFEAFSFLHILLFIFTLIGITLIIVFKAKIREYKYERRIAKGMALFALIWEFSLYAWKIGNGETELLQILPIGLCGFTLFLGIVALYFKKFVLFEIGYFWVWGALASILFPDISYSYDRFRFYQFMIGHMFFFFMYMYMIFVYKWYPTWKSLWKSVITLIIVSVVLAIISNLTNENLMFMLESGGTPLSIFEGYGYAVYLLGVVSLSAGIILLWFTPFLIVEKLHKKQLQQKN